MNSNNLETKSEISGQFLDVAEAAGLLRTTPQTLYLYLSATGTKGGTRRRRFPPDLYVKIGRKTLFVKDRLVSWVLNGGQFC